MRALALLVLVVACGNGGAKPAAPAPPPDASPDAAPTADELAAEVIAAVGGFADKMCTCADDECHAAVQRELAVWEQRHATRYAHLAPAPAQRAQLDAFMQRMAGCTAADTFAADHADELDAVTRAFDRGDFAEAQTRALALLRRDPGNARMLRILVSLSCIAGDVDMARRYWRQLTDARDRTQMQVRCSRYGIEVDAP